MEFSAESVGGGAKEKEASWEISEAEKSKIGIMRAIVEREDPSAEDVDDFMIRRFLRARDLDIKKASKLFLKYLSWRRSFVPNGTISESEIRNDLAQQKLFMQGFDIKGRPIVVIYGGRHNPSQASLEEFKRSVVYSLDKICSRMPGGQEKFLGIADLEGWGYKNIDFRGFLAALSILQDCYPERLGKIFLIHVPYIFMTAWKMIYPFIDPETKKKEKYIRGTFNKNNANRGALNEDVTNLLHMGLRIVFVENKKQTTTLLGDIDESQLPDVYGGRIQLIPIQDS